MDTNAPSPTTTWSNSFTPKMPAARARCSVSPTSWTLGSGSPEGWLCANTMAVDREESTAANTSRGSTGHALSVPSATRASCTSTLRGLKHSTWNTSRRSAPSVGARYACTSFGFRSRGRFSGERCARRPSSSAASSRDVLAGPTPRRAHKTRGSSCTSALSPSLATPSAASPSPSVHRSPNNSRSVRASAPSRKSRSRASPRPAPRALTDLPPVASPSPDSTHASPPCSIPPPSTRRRA
ncbi:hypothetical protein COEX109129_35285 [Corallococcus exiguus]